jgi:MscS family membrane protein
VFTKAENLTKRTQTLFDDIVIHFLKESSSGASFILCLWGGLLFIPFSEKILFFFIPFLLIFSSIFITWKIQSISVLLLKEYKKSLPINIGNSLIPFLENIITVFLWISCILFILMNLGVSINSVIAGLGIGGLAVALALKPSLESFFSSLAIFTDKPFTLGDVIQFQNYTGTITAIGLRTTRLQTFAGTEVVIPNTDLTTQNIENITRRQGVQMSLKIGVTYETSSQKLQDGMSFIKEIIENTEGIINDVRVHFSEFGDSALLISVVYFIDKNQPFLERLQTISSINIAIKEKFEKENISFAYPTQTLYVKNS